MRQGVSSGLLAGGLERAAFEITGQKIPGWWGGPGARGRGGGDEETRTPDPLLAKEMLFQLSYVPSPNSAQTREARWWAFLDSNQRPLPYQGSALTS